VNRTRKPSPQAVTVLGALAARPADWRYGYDLARDTGLKSGTLYPLLIRLHDAGLLEAEWRPASQPGRPARHAYRLTEGGLALARRTMADQAAAPSTASTLVGATA
jgi:DNA-binding PadR family transcriptional regulator